ncbi:MAG: transcription antitermination factor NusB [Hyphomonadaceae bacterium]|nr:transcription antitermination factor NusB [Hyphomonadaceae bacterium]MBC6411730.1 transcription antitermination factor NusB [Hyphomonadaceae bacterium]
MDNPHARKRRTARLAAVQALYQMDVGGAGSKTVIREFTDYRFGFKEEGDVVVADEAFFEDVVLGVVREQSHIDETISDHLSEKWSFDRLDLTLRALMRSAVYETIARPDVPALVILDEYVTLAVRFFDEKQAAFVNATLEKVARKVRTAEFGLTGAA